MSLREAVYFLVGALLIGMTAAALPPIVRALPLPIMRRWLDTGTKPWSCDLCMSIWSTVVATCWWWGASMHPLAGIPAFVVTFAIVRYNSEPIGPPPGLPELEDSGVGVFRGQIEPVQFADGTELRE